MRPSIPESFCVWPHDTGCDNPPGIEFNGRPYCFQHFYHVLRLRAWLCGSFHDFLAVDFPGNGNKMHP